MKEDKIREKYPNIETEEDFAKLCKMLKYKNYQRITALCALVLLALGALLGQINNKIALICVVAVVAVLGISQMLWGKHIDESFLARAGRKKVENRSVLDRETIQKSLKKDIVKQLWSDFITSEFIGLFCLIVWVLAFDKSDEKVPVLIFFGIIPCVAFAAIEIGAFIKIKKSKSKPLILLQTKVANRKKDSSLDTDSTRERYYFIFNCSEYGTLDYEVGINSYLSVMVGVDTYYLVVEKHRLSKNYKIAKIFSAEEYVLSPEFESIVRVI